MPQHPSLPESVVSRDATYPESPRWRDGLLWFSDVHAYTVKTMDATGRVRDVVKVPGRPGGLGFLPDGRLLVAGALDRTLHLWDGRTLETYADLTGVALGLLNDMVVDRDGRAYVSDTGFNLMAGEAQRPGQLIEVTADAVGAVNHRVVTTDVIFPNGSAITADGGHLWLSESAANRVSVFAIDHDGPWERVATHDVADFPDGLCLDTDGGAWVALLREGVFQHLTRDGLVDKTVAVEGRLAVACTFGGPGRGQLFLCSAETTMEQLSQGISTGVISTVVPQTAGAGLP